MEDKNKHDFPSASVAEADVMEFVVFAIESAAQQMGIPAPDLYNRLEKQHLIQNYLMGCYDVLHTQSRQYIADALIEALLNWEAYNKAVVSREEVVS